MPVRLPESMRLFWKEPLVCRLARADLTPIMQPIAAMVVFLLAQPVINRPYVFHVWLILDCSTTVAMTLVQPATFCKLGSARHAMQFVSAAIKLVITVLPAILQLRMKPS